MDLKNVQNQSMRLVLSTDTKPRMKWTPELHQRFIDAISQLGGVEKATPKSLMRVMGIPGLTLYHLKSHLQKYRFGKSPQMQTSSENKQDHIKIHNSYGHCSKEISTETQNQKTESLQISQALQMQMEVQSKLYEQIEVQKHMQLRIEAQGKYLQTVLKKAQEALTGYNFSTLGAEVTKAELSHLVSTINMACPSSSISELTETRGFNLNCGERNKNRGTMCSMESSLTYCESSEGEENQILYHELEKVQKSNTATVEFPLLAIQVEDTRDGASEKKRSAETDSDGGCVDQPSEKRCCNKLRKSEMLEIIDLNS
ncbi:PREDICTED: myb family transcription factor PHL8-like [Lupinus angustifolius]|uniref:myb family transcription factor PHL8-like n=1 Tax=Lupinus angustifolius TaxID=3871 RepID=UPI00092F44DB|nr:PREDICTED: myb family transcription factor PHL8-like [Lupinus angustifolius]